MIKKIICFFALIVLTFSFSFCDEAKEKSKIKITADNTSIPWGEKDKNVVLKGNVSVVYETTKLMSAYVIFNQDTKVAVSPGKVTVNAKETNFTADSGSSDFKNKICKASGNINGFIKKEVSDTIENN
ncbi:MAG: hypothetical protein KBT47_06935, partial [Armatimonadetes bacterium]|nr:hypothetical protein [Candidatus Hippobium faecium]